MEKFQIFDQDRGLTPSEKSRLFNFFDFLILESEKAFFLPRISLNMLSCLILTKNNKNMEKFPIFDRNHRLTPLEESQFFNFFDFLI